jgi:glycosyltransferase involved in cell wall biosynthesis
LTKVSIIIPAYNAQNTIAETIHSILKQSFSDFELIIVNDGSTDDTEKVIQTFSDKRIKYFDQINKGQCAANNFGLSKSEGKYIKFFDADDVMNDKHIEAQYEKIKNSTTSLASCKWGRFYDDDYRSAKFVAELVWANLSSIDWLKTSLSQRHSMMGGCLWLIPKVILDKVGGWDDRLSLNNDFEFSVRVLLGAENVVFADEALFYYRTGVPNSLSLTTSTKSYYDAYLSNLMGCKYLLAVDNSKFVQSLCANRFQEWVYTIYPSNREIVKKFESQIDLWGGSKISLEGGKVLKELSKLFGWKIAKKIKLFLNKYFR